MFQFGKFLTLAIFAVALVYLLTRRRALEALPSLRPFAGPFFMMAAVWLVTAVELVAIRLESGAFPPLMTLQPGAGPAYTEGAFPPAFYMLEHLFGAMAYVWLAVAVWRTSRTDAETPA
jgi:hypothetical protein